MIETESDKRCTICAERAAVATWMCQGEETPEISVCRWCAINELPRLIADAVFGSMPIGVRNGSLGTPRKHSEDAFKDVSANFYKAMSNAALGGMIKPLTFSCLRCNKRQTAGDIRVGASNKKQFVQCIECGYAHEVSWAMTEDVTAVEDEFVQSMSELRAKTDNKE